VRVLRDLVAERDLRDLVAERDLRDLVAERDLRDLVAERDLEAERDLRGADLDLLRDDLRLVTVFLAERAALEADLAAVRAFLANLTDFARDLDPALVLRMDFFALVAVLFALVAFLEAALAAVRARASDRALRATVFWHTFPLLLLLRPFLQGLQGLARGDFLRDLVPTFLATATFFPVFLDLRNVTENFITLPLR